jgi:hypothetical protein
VQSLRVIRPDRRITHAPGRPPAQCGPLLSLSPLGHGSLRVRRCCAGRSARVVAWPELRLAETGAVRGNKSFTRVARLGWQAVIPGAVVVPGIGCGEATARGGGILVVKGVGFGRESSRENGKKLKRYPGPNIISPTGRGQALGR